MSTILFVCTGNLCRSPMAAGLLRKRLAEEGLDARHQVLSAGVWAVDGRPPSENAIAVMAERGSTSPTRSPTPSPLTTWPRQT